jgi:hypothetical protein
MLEYRNNVLQIGITIPDGWKVKKEREKPLEKMFRFLEASLGGVMHLEFTIERNEFFRHASNESLWQLNGLEIFYKERDSECYRTLHWQIDERYSVYGKIGAKDKASFEQLLIVMETLHRFGFEPEQPLRNYVNLAEEPRFYQIKCRGFKKYSDISDLDLKPRLPDEALIQNGRILRGDLQTAVEN